MTKFVYAFNEGNKDMRNLLGGKGANLAEMTSMKLPVPQGFIVTTEACNEYYQNGETISREIETQIFQKLEELELATGKKFGDPEKPLLVSVRSGARTSMPGMMDSILNLGLNDQVVLSFSKNIENERFIYDSYRRLIQMFADVVKGYPRSLFEQALEQKKQQKNVTLDVELTTEDMKEIVTIFKKIYQDLAHTEFPQEPKTQLLEAVGAVFRSWNNERANVYRKMNGIPHDWGTAVNIQEMVYGNLGENSGTGVAFTRNPSTGENKLYGEYLMNAQGEDVVAGIRTPESIETLKTLMPNVYQEFEQIAHNLENHYKDMQDMEFTIENGKLYILQTRNGKRTTKAAVKIAVDLVREGMISKQEAILRVEPEGLDQLLHPTFSEESLKSAKIITKGLAASPGAATGKLYFSAEDVSVHSQECPTILARLETSPEDIQGMNDAKGVLTVRGGMTSHAAVVARGMGRCCVSGCSELTIDEATKTIKTKEGLILKEGDYISLDGSTGTVYEGKLETVAPEISGDFETFMSWADEFRKLGVRTNADTPKDAKEARNFGAEGIGLCRTEHMFFSEERIFRVRQMITAETLEQREQALEQILPMQRGDFEKLFETMDGLTVTIRYLDPPLHEFLPHTEEEMKELATSLNMTFESLKTRVDSLKEFNPMMGHRGCRLAITYPEIARMQTKAVIEAAINVTKKGIKAKPEIMIPLIGDENELRYIKNIVNDVATELIQKSGVPIHYEVGTMIELPRACLIADKIAEQATFFSFGTNDLTQLSYGFSRDDAGKFLNDYYDKKIFADDPFAKIDQNGVGELVKIAIQKGKQIRPDIHLGICGEHGGEPSSVEFCHQIGLTYVSCSPYRVPIARLSAAQAAVKFGTQE